MSWVVSVGSIVQGKKYTGGMPPGSCLAQQIWFPPATVAAWMEIWDDRHRPEVGSWLYLLWGVWPSVLTSRTGVASCPSCGC